MGNRVSISFRNREMESVAVFSHWGGMEFVEMARQYVRDLRQEVGTKKMMPLQRLQPDTVVIDFIRHCTSHMDRVTGDLYLGKNDMDGDNSDNGHFVLDLGEETKNEVPSEQKGS